MAECAAATERVRAETSDDLGGRMEHEGEKIARLASGPLTLASPVPADLADGRTTPRRPA